MRYFLLLIICVILAGCSKHTIQTTNTKFPLGQKLYFSKCSGCHRTFDRLEYSPEKWDSILVTMRSKAKITIEQEKEILLFLKERD